MRSTASASPGAPARPAHEGEARGIDDDGALVVFTDAGERVRLDAGEVHLERRSSDRL